MVKILCWYLRALSSYVRCGCDFLVRGLSKNVDGRMNAGWIRGWQGGRKKERKKLEVTCMTLLCIHSLM